jgi:phosphatidate cytidylyltransferase
MAGGGKAKTLEKRKGLSSNLALRAFSSLAALFLAYAALRRDLIQADSGNWGAALLAAGIGVACLREFYRMARADGSRPFSAAVYVLGPLWLLASEWELSGGTPLNVNLVLPAAAAIIVMLLQLTRKSNDNAIANVAVTLFGLIYCFLLPGVFLHLLRLELAPGGWPMDGIEFMTVCVFAAKAADVGALMIGGRWGRSKMIPRLSPGKTWEGAAGGLALSVVLLQFMVFTAPRMALARLGTGRLILLSLVLTAAGMAGDLAESAFKRGGRRKDAGSGVPGFGGMLDLVDSLILAAPAMYLFLLLCGARHVPA